MNADRRRSAEPSFTTLDHLGQRRLRRGEAAVWYVVAGITYVLASLLHKGLLNWVVGPIWLVATVWAGPLLVDHVRGRG